MLSLQPHRTMRLCLAVIALPLVVALSSVATAQDDKGDSAAPIQLAQYPGAPFEDRNGNLWFGTVLDGLIRYDGNEFATFTKEDGLGSDMVGGGIVEDEGGTLWIATSGGLTKYDGTSFKTLTEYEPLKVTHGFGEHGNHRAVSDVMIDKHGDIWIATMDGVFRYDGKLFTRFPMPVIASRGKFEFTPRRVSCIYEDRDGDLWFGTDGAGVVRYDGNTTVVYTMEGHGLSSDNVCAVLQDKRGDFWFGTANGGVSHYDGTTFTTHLRSKEFSKHSGWGRYLGIHEDRQGYVWFGAAYAGGGVYRYDGNSFEYLSEKDGLGTGGVPSIREDRSGNLWFGTTAGVYHFDGERFINFTRNNPQLPAQTKDVEDTSDGHDSDPVSLEGWASETFALPPDFAPELPAGNESLRFAPGWRDPNSENFWSYAFVMSIDEPAPDAARIEELLKVYYDGLMSVFASNKDRKMSIRPARVEVDRTASNHYEAKMHLIDAFATFVPVEIGVLVETVADSDEHSFVRIRVSRQPYEHKIWRSLEAAIESIQFPDD